MSITHKVGVTYTADGVTKSSTVGTYTGDGDVSFDGTIPGPTVKQEIDVAFDKTKVKSMIFISSQDGTLYTNNSGSPVDTIAFLANVPIIWTIDHNEAIPFSVSVTKFFISIPGSVAANVAFHCLLDVTP